MDQTLPKLLARIAREYPEIPGQFYRNTTGSFDPVCFREIYSIVLDYAAGFLSLGHGRGDHIGIIADNRKEWFHTSLAIMAIGAADVPRGCDASAREITYILAFSDCKTVVLENDSQAQKILAHRETMPDLSSVILFDPLMAERERELETAGLAVHDYRTLIETGKSWRAQNPGRVEAELERGAPDDLATIIFTSGTTGVPKGVMLSHDNFLCQLEELPERIILHPGDRALCVLPVWHSFERMCEYVILHGASAIIYSKPVGSVLLGDFVKMNPQLMPSVPRIWESVYDGIFRAMRKTGGISWILFSFFVNVAIIDSRFERRVKGQSPSFRKNQRSVDFFLYLVPFLILHPLKVLGGILVFSKIRARLGTSFTGGVSGGGALPPNIDEFFWAVGINVVEGYGLTETAPVVAVRPFVRPVFGTIGKPISCCQVKIVGEDGKELPPGVKGTVMIQGRNVMKGYYNKHELTAKVLSPDGWLDTGDLGLKTIHGEIILRGRKKDTIVLRGGENIEPAPLEMKINESRFIGQSVVLGQDQRYLGALVVVNRDEVTAWARENGIREAGFSALLQDGRVKKLFEAEIAELVSARNGYRMFERIHRFVLLEKPFETGVELSAKQEIMRYKLDELYKKEIRSLFD